jgi:putative peptidoglycan lipid II flippase
VWGVLAGSAVGLLASTSGRLYSSAFYALRDTRTPLNFALIRVTLTLGLGYLFALPLPRLLHVDRHWGVAGLTLSAGIAGWVEFVLLRRGLHARIGVVPYETPRVLRLWAVAVLAGVVAFAFKRILPIHNARLVGCCVLPVYGAIYLALTQWMGIASLGPLARILKRR